MRIRTLIAAMILLTASAGAQEEPAIRNEKDKINYGIGVGVARNFQRQGLTVDLDLVIKGMRDVLSDAKLAMTEAELDATMTAFQREAQSRLQIRRAVVADRNKLEGENFLAANARKEGVVVLPSGLQYKIEKAGDGKKPTLQDSVECHYRGTLINGVEFDNSQKRGKPLVLKVGGTIPGWTEALQLMPVGSKWQLFVPSKLAYGEKGAGSQIDPNATLIFDVELLAIK